MTRRNRPKGKQFRSAAGKSLHTRAPDVHWSRRAIVVVVAIKIAGLVLIFDTASAQPFEGPKSGFSLATACLLLALIAVTVVRSGVSTFPRTRMHVYVAAFSVATLVAVAFAQDRYIGLFGAERRLGLTFVFDMLVLYVAVVLGFRTQKDWASLAGVVATAGAAMMTYGLVQYAGLDPIPWVDDVRVRPPSTLGNPDKFGHFLGVTLVAALSLAVLPMNQSGLTRILATLYTVTAVGTAGLTASRGTLLGVVVALVAVGIVYLRLSRLRMNRRTAVGGFAAASCLMVVASALVVTTPLGERIRKGFGDSGTQQRLFIADAAVRAFRDQPLIGHGPDHFGVIYPQYRAPRSLDTGILVNQNSAHSWPLQAAVTTGALGAATLSAIVLGSLILLWRGIATSPQVAAPILTGAVAYWTHGLVTTGSVSVDWIGWVAAAGAATFGRRSVETLPRHLSFPMYVGPIVAALVLAVSVVPSLEASRELKTAKVARSDRLGPAERAVRLDSGRAEHWFALGLVRQDLQMWALAAQAFRGATERAPYVSAHWTNLSLSLTNLALKGDGSLGGKEAALTAARQAVRVDPYYPTPYHVLALVYNSLGNYADALDASTAAIRLYKGDPKYEVEAANAALNMPDVAAARAGLEHVVAEKEAVVLRVALARLSLKLSDPDAARMHLRRALEVDPRSAPALELARQIGVIAP